MSSQLCGPSQFMNLEFLEKKKITTRLQVLCITLAKIKPSLKIKTQFWQALGKLALPWAAGGSINWYNPSGGKFGTSNKSLKNALTHSSSVAGDIFPEEIIKSAHQALCTRSLPCSASWPAVNTDGPTQAWKPPDLRRFGEAGLFCHSCQHLSSVFLSQTFYFEII